MTEVFTLPDLGEGLEEAELVRWLVRVGDTVAVDGPVAEVETAKAMVEVPCPYAGVVARLHGEAGDVIAVGSPLVSVDPAAAPTAEPEPEPVVERAAEPVAASTGSGNVLIGYGTSDAPVAGAGRRALRRAAARAGHDERTEHQVLREADASRVGASGAGTRSAGVSTGRPERRTIAVASPIVRSLAKAHDVDLARLDGTGPGGVITRSDVERAARQAECGRVQATRPAAAVARHDAATDGTPAAAPAPAPAPAPA
ncbi:E3 binding domain-containing protein, partial [Actinotalea ferrariae]|uniref:biotin/lipoyl-containing protein n=1 Tax=Actinotalea ferrariae TaxID=1386098 RepID=UPI001C8C4987